MLPVVGIVALALGCAAGWWVGVEVGRGMPWGFFAAAVAVAFACVLAPYIWPSVIGELTTTALRSFAGGLATTLLISARDHRSAGPSKE